MKNKDIIKKSEQDLKKLLHELSEELREFRFSMSGGAKKNVRKGRELRYTIARIKTMFADKKLATPESSDA